MSLVSRWFPSSFPSSTVTSHNLIWFNELDMVVDNKERRNIVVTIAGPFLIVSLLFFTVLLLFCTVVDQRSNINTVHHVFHV